MTKLTTDVVHSPDPNANIEPLRASTQLCPPNVLNGQPIHAVPFGDRYDWRSQSYKMFWQWSANNATIQWMVGRLNALEWRKKRSG